MCGIIGFSWNDEHLIKKLIKEIEHRGPDQNGFFTDKTVSLGHQRLSIIDLSEKGRQPMSTKDGKYTVVFNGEIYNHNEIRKKIKADYFSGSDTETILQAYSAYGTDCVKHFNGMFAFCIYDSMKKQLFFARDRFGEKPLYYTFHNGEIFFASELQAILKSNLFNPEIDEIALYEYLKLRYTPGPKTIIKNIFKLPPSCCLLFDLKNKTAMIWKYWSIDEEPQPIEGLPELIKDAVKIRLMSDVPLGVFLSGGIDSSSVVGMMRKINPDAQPKTFSIGFEDWQYNETQYAKAVADYYNTEHHELFLTPRIAEDLPKIVERMDEPLGDPAAIPVYYLAKEAKKKVTVVLTGDGADEAFGGYDQYRFLNLIQKLKILPKPVRGSIVAMARLTPYWALNKIYRFSKTTGKEMFTRLAACLNAPTKIQTYELMMGAFNEEQLKELYVREAINKPLFAATEQKYFSDKRPFLEQLQIFDLDRYLPDDLMMKSDKMCMAHAVEARAPYLDHRLVTYGVRLQTNQKISFTETKIELKNALRTILPPIVLNRKKQPFQLPLNTWLKKDLVNFAQPKTVAETGYFKPEEIQKIWDKFDSSPLYYGRQLWNLLCFTEWHKQFMA